MTVTVVVVVLVFVVVLYSTREVVTGIVVTETL